MSVLILSEHPELSQYVVDLIRDIASKEQIDIGYSPGHPDPSGFGALSGKAYDLSDDEVVQTIIDNYRLVISLHCRQLFPPRMVDAVRCINSHPGLNPHNRGYYPQVFSILNGLPTGATIHEIDNAIDHGAIIAQEQVDIADHDTSGDVYRRIVDAERRLLARHIASIIDGSYETRVPVGEGNLNRLRDFKKLCALDMNSVGTLREHVDLLRALGHGSFKNAHYVGDDGRKRYLTISFSVEDQVDCG